MRRATCLKLSLKIGVCQALPGLRNLHVAALCGPCFGEWWWLTKTQQQAQPLGLPVAKQSRPLELGETGSLRLVRLLRFLAR